MPELTFILATLATIVFIAFVMTAAKLAMYMFFSFMYPKNMDRLFNFSYDHAHICIYTNRIFSRHQ